jgi:hypothetical protein
MVGIQINFPAVFGHMTPMKAPRALEYITNIKCLSTYGHPVHLEAIQRQIAP